MEIQNVALLHNEIVACGIFINGADSSGNIQISSRPTCPEGEELTWTDPTDNLVVLCLAAHEKALSSDECLALMAELTPEQWLAYQDCRKAPIRQQREARYRSECDPLRMKMDEDHDTNSTEWATALLQWKAAKALIRQALPYPE